MSGPVAFSISNTSRGTNIKTKTDMAKMNVPVDEIKEVWTTISKKEKVQAVMKEKMKVAKASVTIKEEDDADADVGSSSSSNSICSSDPGSDAPPAGPPQHYEEEIQLAQDDSMGLTFAELSALDQQSGGKKKEKSKKHVAFPLDKGLGGQKTVKPGQVLK
jgi:hypothetical protein